MKEELDQRFFAKRFREKNGQVTLKVGMNTMQILLQYHARQDKVSIKFGKGYLTIMSDEGISIVYYDTPIRHGKIMFIPFDKKRKKNERIT